MKQRRIFMFGLTIFIFMAVYLYYTMQNLLKIQLESKENSSAFKKIDVYLAYQEDEEMKDGKQKNLQKQNLLTKKQKNWRESIHLSVVVCGDRANETFILLKSAFFFSKSFIIVHIFAEEELHIHLNKQLDEWLQHVRGKFDYYLYGISHSKLENFTDWKKMFKPCAIQSLFLPTLLPSVDSLLYVDTDTIFLSPLEEIWSHFKQFNSSQLAAMAPDNEEKEKSWYSEFSRHPYFGRFGVNSGVRLMNLTRMRNSTWTESMFVFYREYKPKIWWGDQDLINIYFHFHPDQLYVYNCEWNYRSDHCMCTNVCMGANRHGAYILHGSRRVIYNDKHPAFKAVYAGFHEFNLLKDMKQHLLENLKKKLDLTNSTPCGRAPHIFTKRIEYFIENDPLNQR